VAAREAKWLGLYGGYQPLFDRLGSGHIGFTRRVAKLTSFGQASRPFDG
jgi:hypothetical protein